MSDTPQIKPHSFQAWIAFMRPKTFWIAAIPVFVGTSLSFALLDKFNFWTFLLTLGGAVCIQALSNMQNDFGYNKRKAERSNRTGLPRATTEGWISMRNAQNMIAFTTLLCFAFVIPLVFIGGWPIVAIAVLSLLCAFFYMAGPLPISYTPFGEVFVLIFYGWVAVGGTFWLQTHSFSWFILSIGTALGLFGAAVLFVNNYRDIEHDISVGRKTLPSLFGKQQSFYLFSFLIYFPFILIGWVVPVKETFWPLLLTLLALPKASFLPFQFKQAQGLACNALMFNTVKIEFLFGILLTVGLLWTGYLNFDLHSLIPNIFRCPF